LLLHIYYINGIFLSWLQAQASVISPKNTWQAVIEVVKLGAGFNPINLIGETKMFAVF
jgi:hypothetical protein